MKAPSRLRRGGAILAAVVLSSFDARAETPIVVPSVEAAPASAPEMRAHLYVFGLGLGLGVGGAVSWKFIQTWTGHFTTLNEGWFGKDTYAGGSDKLGHFFTDYLLVRALREIYAEHGFGEDSILNALFAGTVIRTVMEVCDGFTTFKFSPQDLIANMSGAVTSALLLSHPQLDDLLSMSWTYLPSTEKLGGKVDWESIDNDYNGSIYHWDMRLRALARMLSDDGAGPWDLYTVGISYYTRGYDREREYKQRVVGLTVGLNLAEMVERHAAPDGIAYKMRPVLRYFKLPFTFGGPTYDLDHKKTGFRFGLNYFY